MYAPSPFWSAQVPCEQFVSWFEPRLELLGLGALQTFDLHDARLAAPDCACPHHGTAECDCQMVVLLVYADAHPPVTLVLHGNDGKTWVSVIDRPDQRADAGTMLVIRRALEDEPLSPA